MKKTSVLFTLFLFLSTILFYSGCNDSSTEPSPAGPETVATTISGTVLDDSNRPVFGAEVKSGEYTAVTNSDGGFILSGINVPKDRFVVNASKTGYFRGSAADVPKANGASSVRIYLSTAAVTQTVSSASGGEVMDANGTGVEIKANSVSKKDGSSYTGNVKVSVGYLDPTSEEFSSLVPGGDMAAQRTDNSSVTLYSYGIIKVEIETDGGEDLNIKSGSTSTITVDIPPSMEGDAPATIPLWYYDDAAGLWKEEGTAAKQGDKYVGTVQHFSDWNCDVPEGTATVKGLVVDCNNSPVPGIAVRVGQANANTGPDGRFERRVPANTAFEVQVLGDKNFGLTSTAVQVPPLSEGTVRDLGTLNVDCPVYVKGIVKCGTEIKHGQVVISWDGGYNIQYTDAEGKFNMPTDIAKSAEVSIYTFDNKYKTINITTPAVRGEVLDLGTISVCEQSETGENRFTPNGGGFNNKTFVFTSDTLNVFGYYSPEDSATFIWMQQTITPDTVIFWLSFKGNTLGTASEVFFYLFYNSSYFYSEEEVTGAVVNVTKYSGPGGLIEGTFSGTLTDVFGTSGNVSLTGGQFSVIRTFLESRINKIIKEKIPIQIRSKMNIR